MALEPDRIEGSDTDAPLYEDALVDPRVEGAADVQAVVQAIARGIDPRTAIDAYAGSRAVEILAARGIGV